MFLVLTFLTSLSPASSATDFVDADGLTLSTRTTYFLNLEVDGRPVEVEVNPAEYQLLSKLNKLGWRERFSEMDENTPNLVASLNQKAVARFGRPIVVTSDGGLSLYRAVADLADPMFQVLARGLLYRGEEVNLTEKETAVVKALASAPEREMTFQDLASAVGWNGRNYRTNVRTYMDSINVKTWQRTGAELLRIEGRGKAVRLAVIEPARYTERGAARVHGRIMRLEGTALAVADVFGRFLRENLPEDEIRFSEEDMRALNLNPRDVLVGLRTIYAAVDVPPAKVKVLGHLGGKTMGAKLDGSDGEHFAPGHRYCKDFLL